jgi:hypothetical protein
MGQKSAARKGQPRDVESKAAQRRLGVPELAM